MGQRTRRWAGLGGAFTTVGLLLAGVADAEAVLIRPAGVFTADDRLTHAGWEVLVEGNRIKAVGPRLAAPAGARTISLPGATLLPGLMDIHSHLFLHPYNETLWDDQVLKESLVTRTLRAARQAKATLDNGFTTLRDLGTEGAGNSDVYLERAINDGLIPGPRLQVVTRAIVAVGAYGPARRDYAVTELPQGAEEASGVDGVNDRGPASGGGGRGLDQGLCGLWNRAAGRIPPRLQPG